MPDRHFTGYAIRPRHHTWLWVVATALLVAAATAAVVLVALLYHRDNATGDVRPAPALFGPSEGGEGERWSHRELLDYLNGRGPAVEGFTTPKGAAHGPAQWWFEPKSLEGTDWHRIMAAGNLDGADVPAPKLYVQKRATAAAAHDAAGSQRSAFAWGRFLFSGDAAMLAKVRAALGVRQ